MASADKTFIQTAINANSPTIDPNVNYKGRMNEYCMIVGKVLPAVGTKKSGPDHVPSFSAYANWDGINFIATNGVNVKQAEQAVYYLIHTFVNNFKKIQEKPKTEEKENQEQFDSFVELPKTPELPKDFGAPRDSIGKLVDQFQNIEITKQTGIVKLAKDKIDQFTSKVDMSLLKVYLKTGYEDPEYESQTLKQVIEMVKYMSAKQRNKLMHALNGNGIIKRMAEKQEIDEYDTPVERPQSMISYQLTKLHNSVFIVFDEGEKVATAVKVKHDGVKFYISETIRVNVPTNGKFVVPGSYFPFENNVRCWVTERKHIFVKLFDDQGEYVLIHDKSAGYTELVEVGKLKFCSYLAMNNTLTEMQVVCDGKWGGNGDFAFPALAHQHLTWNMDMVVSGDDVRMVIGEDIYDASYMPQGKMWFIKHNKESSSTIILDELLLMGMPELLSRFPEVPPSLLTQLTALNTWNRQVADTHLFEPFFSYPTFQNTVEWYVSRRDRNRAQHAANGNIRKPEVRAARKEARKEAKKLVKSEVKKEVKIITRNRPPPNTPKKVQKAIRKAAKATKNSVAERLIYMFTNPFEATAQRYTDKFSSEPTALVKAPVVSPTYFSTGAGLASGETFVAVFRDPFRAVVMYDPNPTSQQWQYAIQWTDGTSVSTNHSTLYNPSALVGATMELMFPQTNASSSYQPHGPVLYACRSTKCARNFTWIDSSDAASVVRLNFTAVLAAGEFIVHVYEYKNGNIELDQVVPSTAASQIEIVLGHSGYYGFDISGSNTVAQQLTTGVVLGTCPVFQHQTIAYLSNNATALGAHHVLATSFLWTNNSPTLYTQGTVSMFQYRDNARPWTSFASLPLKDFQRTRGVVTMDARKGAYAWMKPSGVDMFAYKDPCRLSGSTVVRAGTNLDDNIDVLILRSYITDANGQKYTLTATHICEYFTEDVWKESREARMNPEAWDTALMFLKPLRQYSENPDHITKFLEEAGRLISNGTDWLLSNVPKIMDMGMKYGPIIAEIL